MNLSRISLKQFRSYNDAQFSFDPHLTLITGQNGVGKTNLLEAIYVLLQGNSFRVTDKEMIHHGERWWRLDGQLNDSERQVRYQLEHHPPKQLVINGSAKRFMHTDRLPVVLFEPNDLLLVHGSPTRRRDTLDMMLGTLSSAYKTTLSRYERALIQRNNALKKADANLEDRLFSWDVLLSEYGVEIILARQKIITQINKQIAGYYGKIAGDLLELSVEYHTSAGQDITASKYIAHLHAKRQLDTLRGTTSFGPHRDDYAFTLRGSDARQTASRGEVRTILLSLKLAYAALMEQSYKTKPLILLDDVLSELDINRQSNLLVTLGGMQVIMTDTKLVKNAAKLITL